MLHEEGHREDRVAELCGLVPAGEEDALGLGELPGRHRLAGDRHLAAHPPQRLLARLRNFDVRCYESEHIGDVARDDRRRARRA